MNPLLFVAALLGLASVAVGAAADHAMDLTDELRASLDVALRYNMVYAVLLAAMGLAGFSRRALQVAGGLFAAGTALFCGGIYGAILLDIPGAVYATPAGGMILMAGWTALGYAALRRAA